MRSHRLLWVFSALLIMAICAIVVSGRPQRPGITQENFDRIHIGMTEAEVLQILGGPPGNYAHYAHRPFDEVDAGRNLYTRRWNGDEGIVDVKIYIPFTFNPKLDPLPANKIERVVSKTFIPLPPEPILQRIRRLIGW